MSCTMAARQHLGGTQRLLLAAIAVLGLATASSGQTFFYYDANGHSQGKVICTEGGCEVFASSTSLGMVLADGTAYDRDGYRVGYSSQYGQNWRPGNFSVRPALPAAEAGSSADPNGWPVPLQEALRSDSVGGDIDRVQIRALQAAAIAYGAQHNFVSAADAELQRRATAPHQPNVDATTVSAIVVHDSDQNAYVMVRGLWVLTIGKASNSNQVTVWWPSADQVETAVAPLTEVMQMLGAAGIVLSSDDANRVQHLTLREARAADYAPPSELCVSGDPKLRAMVEDAIEAWHRVKLNCSDAGNDMVLSVNPTGRWISVMQLEGEPSRFRAPRTAFEAIGVLRDRAGQELWWVRKTAWNGRGDRTQVAQQIAKAFKKFYSAHAPQHQPERPAEIARSGSGAK
jgi:hypothetical protein